MKKIKSLRPRIWTFALVWGLLILAGCQTTGIIERPSFPQLPQGASAYFAADLEVLGEDILPVFQEAGQPKAVITIIEDGRQAYGAYSTSDVETPQVNVVLEGDYSSFVIGLGLTFSSQWKKTSDDYWNSIQGTQIAVRGGGDRLYFGTGGIESLLIFEKPQDLVAPLNVDDASFLLTGDVVAFGLNGDILNQMMPVFDWSSIERWSFILNQTDKGYPGMFSISMGNAGAARFLGTTLKFLFIGVSSKSDEQSIEGPDLLSILGSGSISREDKTVTISDFIITHEAFKAVLNTFISVQGGE